MIAPKSLYAAEVKRRISKGRIVIDQGKKNDFTVGKIVCFFNKEDKKVGCGKIVSAQEERSAVKTKPNVFNKVTRGFQARLRDTSPKGILSTMRGLLKNPRMWFSQRSKARPGTYFLRSNLSYHISPAANLSEIYYKASDSENPSSNWFTEEREGSRYGGQVEFGFPLWTKWLTLGFRYVPYEPIQRKRDLEYGSVEPYALSTNEVQSYGFWFDYTIQKFPITRLFTLSLKTGLDIEQSTISFKLDSVTETPTKTESAMARIDSAQTLLSIRLGADLAYYFGQTGIVLGVCPYFPVYTTGAQLEKDQLADLIFPDADAAKSDFQEQLNHTKNFLGLEVRLGVEFLF